MPLLFVLKICHFTAVAVWIGAGLGAPRDVRRTLLLGQPHTKELMVRLKRTAQLMNGAALATIATGLLLVFAAGGFGRIPHRIHLGLALTGAVYLAGRYLIRPVIVQIAESTRRDLAPEEAHRLGRRFSAAVGVEDLLRLVVLVLMAYPFSF